MWLSGCGLHPGDHRLKIAKEGERLAGNIWRSTSANQEGKFEKAQHGIHFGLNPFSPARQRESKAPRLECLGEERALRPCQTDCLKACAKGARIIEMACGTGKTRVIKELVTDISGRVPCLFM